MRSRYNSLPEAEAEVEVEVTEDEVTRGPVGPTRKLLLSCVREDSSCFCFARLRSFLCLCYHFQSLPTSYPILTPLYTLRDIPEFVLPTGSVNLSFTICHDHTLHIFHLSLPSFAALLSVWL